MTDELRATARLAFDKQPPVSWGPHAAETRSLLLYFLDADARPLTFAFGAVITAKGVSHLIPGLSDVDADLQFWEPDVAAYAVADARFLLWYGGFIGSGVIIAA